MTDAKAYVAALPGWPLAIIAVDIIWGAAATGVAAAGEFPVARTLS